MAHVEGWGRCALNDDDDDDDDDDDAYGNYEYVNNSIIK